MRKVMKMNAIITQYKKTGLLVVAIVAMSMGSSLLAGCTSCAQAAAIRQSIKDAHAALVANGKKVSREMELDAINSVDTNIVEACCAYCAETGMYCGGENSDNCKICQAALEKIAAVDKAKGLNSVDAVRAARESLNDPCNTDNTVIDGLNVCDLNCKLQALFNCCVNTNQHVVCQGRAAEKCCKKLRHDIDDVDDRVKDCCKDIEELIVSQIDQSAECCTTINERLGSLDESAMDIPVCDFSIVDTVNNLDADVITWLKSLYVLMYQVYMCSCQPCIE